MASVRTLNETKKKTFAQCPVLNTFWNHCRIDQVMLETFSNCNHVMNRKKKHYAYGRNKNPNIARPAANVRHSPLSKTYKNTTKHHQVAFFNRDHRHTLIKRFGTILTIYSVTKTLRYNIGTPFMTYFKCSANICRNVMQIIARRTGLKRLKCRSIKFSLSFLFKTL